MNSVQKERYWEALQSLKRPFTQKIVALFLVEKGPIRQMDIFKKFPSMKAPAVRCHLMKLEDCSILRRDHAGFGDGRGCYHSLNLPFFASLSDFLEDLRKQVRDIPKAERLEDLLGHLL